MSWWHVLLLGLSGYFAGVAHGRNQVTDDAVQRRLDHMQDLISQAHEKTELMKRMWLDAEEKAESWERRYNALVPEEKE